jgi:hypothetical protein
MIRRVRRMTPREAIAYVSSADVEASAERVSVAYLAATVLALILGAIKFTQWATGYSLLDSLQPEDVHSIGAQAISILDVLLTFFAVPLLLFGIVGLLRWRVKWIQFVLVAITAPLAGKLRWFIAEHMALNQHRIASTLFIASLAMSLALLPQVAADTFYDRLLRGVQISVGGDVQIEYNMIDLARYRATLMAAPAHQKTIERSIAGIEAAIRADPKVDRLAFMTQFIAPDIYLPNQTGLFINLVRSPQEYLDTVCFEEGLGVSRPFSEIIRASVAGPLVASTGFLALRQIPLDRDMAIAHVGDEPIQARFRDVIAFLPGQPSVDVAQREGYAQAEVDYLNYLLGADARAVSSIERFGSAPLSGLKLLPSRAVFIVRMKDGTTQTEIENLIDALPVKPELVRSLAQERRRLGRDMFISLALASMKVFLIGGLILAVAGVAVIGLANFLSERRTFSLLRLRGLPVQLLLRISLAIFLAPVAAGVVVGVLLGTIAGFGISEAVWQLPRVYGIAGLLHREIVFSASAGGIIAGCSVVLLLVALGFALWPFRRSAHENVRKS